MSCVPFNVERPDPSLTRLFARFALSGLVAVIVIGAVAFVVIRHAASAGAIRQAQGLTRLAGRGIAEPAITPGVLAGRPADLAALDYYPASERVPLPCTGIARRISAIRRWPDSATAVIAS